MEYKCPTCGGAVWDNRPKKQSGDFSPKAPDFKCKDKDCGGVIWRASEYEFLDDTEPAKPQGNSSSAKAFKSSIGEQEAPDWDAINRGKVRCQVAVAFIRQGEQAITDSIEQLMEHWVDYIMNGPKTD